MTNEEEDFDWGEPGRRPLNASETQIRFVKAVLRGKNRTEAAREAGYGGDERTLRSTGSRTHNSPKIQGLLAMVQSHEDGRLDPEGTSTELRQILWKEARYSSNPSSKLRAAELLAKHFDATEADADQLDPIGMLDGMQQLGPIIAGYAELMAPLMGVYRWKMTDETWGRLERHHPELAEYMRLASRHRGAGTGPLGAGAPIQTGGIQKWTRQQRL